MGGKVGGKKKKGKKTCEGVCIFMSWEKDGKGSGMGDVIGPQLYYLGTGRGGGRKGLEKQRKGGERSTY